MKGKFILILIVIFSINFGKSLVAEDSINTWQKVKFEFEKSTLREKAYIDNIYIQTYQGQAGIWKKVTSGTDLTALAKPYSSSIEQIISVNDLPKNSLAVYAARWIFIPYSEQYLKELEKNGISRITWDVSVNEYIWPIDGLRITSRLGQRLGKFHPGIDIAAHPGTLVLAAMDGEISESKYLGDYGNAVIIKHNDSYVTIYGHLAETLVKKGDKVKKGQVVGFSGNTGHSTGPHLHFEVRYASIILNPEVFMPMFKEDIYVQNKKDTDNNLATSTQQ